MKRTRTLLLLALLPLALSGCNSGALLLLLLLDDGGGGGGGSGGAVGPAFIDFEGIDNARSMPANATVRVRLRRERGPAPLTIEYRDLDAGGDFSPITLRSPLPGSTSGPGAFSGLPTSATGVVHAIGWDALADLGDDTQHRVRLRFSGEFDEPLEVQVLVGNDAPEIAEAMTSQEPGGDVTVDVTLVDSAFDPVDVMASFTLEPIVDGEPEPAFAIATTDGETRNLSTADNGGMHSFEWLNRQDIGRLDRPAVLRLVPIDVIPGETGKMGAPVDLPLDVDGNASPRIEFLGEDFASDLDQRRGIAVRVRVVDREQNPVDVFAQWATGSDDFPELPADFDESSALREEALASPEQRRALQIATFAPDALRGIVEEPIGVEVSADGLLATWILATEELGGIVDKDFLVGHTLRILAADGSVEQERRICEFFEDRGTVFVDVPFDPPPTPGAIVEVDLSSTTYLSSSAAGIPHLWIWDSETDLPGGGDVRFRFTPFDRAADATDDGCGLIALNDEPEVARGARGIADANETPKETLGPYAVSESIGVPPQDLPGPVAVVDFDDDTSLDIVYAARGTNTVVALLQTKPGRYDVLRLPDASLDDPSGIVVGDFSGNGLADVATTSRGNGRLIVIHQLEGRDFFTDRRYLGANVELSSPADIVAADFDGDDDIDFAVLEDDDDPRVIVFHKSGGAPAEDGCADEDDGYVACAHDLPAGVYTTLAVGSLGGDDRSDLLAGASNQAAVLTRVDGGFDVASLNVSGAVVGASIADVDGDGRNDAVFIADSGEILVHAGVEGGGVSADSSLLGRAATGASAIAALPGGSGGLRGLVVTNEDEDSSALEVALPNAEGEYSSHPIAGAETTMARGAPAVVDLDADGSLDIVSFEHVERAGDPGPASAIVVYREDTRGSFTGDAERSDFDPPSRPSASTIANINGGNYTEIVTVHREANALVCSSPGGGGTFETVVIDFPAEALGPMAVAVADINGDNFPDVITANADSNNLAIIAQAEDRTFTAGTTILSPANLVGPQALAVADHNGDGLLDIVTAGRISNTLHLLLQQEDGSFLEVADALVPAEGAEGPIALLAEDLDRNGRIDIVVAYHRSEEVGIFLQGAGAQTIALESGDRPVSLAAADIDGDGRLDVVTANTTGNSVSLLAQGADGTFSTGTYLAPPEEGREPTAVATGDFDTDGRADVAVAFAGDLPSSVVALLTRDGADPVHVELGDPAMDAPVDLEAVDLDGDGELDLITTNRESRNASVFYGGR